MLRKNHFTLIEIMMALAVLSVGMVAILGAFAVGFKANSDVIAEGMADEAAKNIMAWIKYNKAAAIGVVGATNSPAPGDIAVPNLSAAPPADAWKNSMTQDAANWKSPTNWAATSTSVKALAMPFSGGNILKKQVTDSFGTYHIYKVIRYKDLATDLNNLGGYGSESYYDPAYDNLEFEGNAVAWISQLTPTAVPPVKPVSSAVVQVTIEVSWPVSLPYDQRKKYLYSEEF